MAKKTEPDFHVWLARPKMGWPKKAHGRSADDAQNYVMDSYEPNPMKSQPRRIAGPFVEPAEAADFAEEILKRFGKEDQSWCELRYYGEPHTLIFYLEGEIFGVWNTEHSEWPIFYPTSEYGVMLDGYPEGMEPMAEGDAESDSDGFGDEDEDSDIMDLSGGMEDDEDASDAEEDDDAEDEFSEDDESDEDIFAEDDEGEDEIEDEDSDDGDVETEDDEPEEDEGDGRDESDEETDEQGENEEETEMPRLNIFAKMRGPKGWRKRADAEELLERNAFGFKVGVLDPDEEKTNAQREKEIVAEVQFIEDDSMREAGILRMKLPTVNPDEIQWRKRGAFIEAVIPYRKGE